MSHQTGILEALQDWGFKLGYNGPMGVLPYAGWQTRGSTVFDPMGSVNHHTAGAPVGNLPSLNVLLYGRSDVPGPLCNGALARNAAIHLLAAGRANHAGKGSFRGITGNSHVWGLEVEHIGYPSEVVGEDRWRAMFAWHRACADFSGFTPTYVCQHFEWAPTRKIDFVKPITDPAVFRLKVEQVRKPSTQPPITRRDTDMAFMARKSSKGAVLCVTGNAAVLVTSMAMFENHKKAGIPVVECDDNQFSRYEKMRVDVGSVTQTEV